MLLFNFSANAQKFTTHPVKKGETLESIAKQYKVTPHDILTFNKEIKQGASLEKNTILVIPLDAPKIKSSSNTLAKPTESLEISEETKEMEQKVQEEPIGFTTHKVRKRETLYGIATLNVIIKNYMLYN